MNPPRQWYVMALAEFTPNVGFLVTRIEILSENGPTCALNSHMWMQLDGPLSYEGAQEILERQMKLIEDCGVFVPDYAEEGLEHLGCRGYGLRADCGHPRTAYHPVYSDNEQYPKISCRQCAKSSTQSP